MIDMMNGKTAGENNGGQAALPDSAGRLPACRDSLAGYPPNPTGDVELREATMRLMRGENLARTEAASFLNALLNPAATDAQVAAALAVLAVKGETVEELAGMAEAMRNRAIPVRCHHERFIDTAGTGSSADRKSTRLNSSHGSSSYADFCWKKKKKPAR